MKQTNEYEGFDQQKNDRDVQHKKVIAMIPLADPNKVVLHACEDKEVEWTSVAKSLAMQIYTASDVIEHYFTRVGKGIPTTASQDDQVRYELHSRARLLDDEMNAQMILAWLKMYGAAKPYYGFQDAGWIIAYLSDRADTIEQAHVKQYVREYMRDLADGMARCSTKCAVSVPARVVYPNHIISQVEWNNQSSESSDTTTVVKENHDRRFKRKGPMPAIVKATIDDASQTRADNFKKACQAIEGGN